MTSKTQNDETDYVQECLDYARLIKDDFQLARPKIKNIGKREKHAWIKFYNEVTQPPEDVAWKFDRQIANKWCRFMETLHVPAGVQAGLPFKLSMWQKLVISNIIGFYVMLPIPGREEHEVRQPRFTELYLEIGRGNGKTTFLGAILVAGICLIPGNGHNYYSAATTRDQATIVLNCAREILNKTPGLKAAFGVRVNAFNVTRKATNTNMKALSKDSSTLDGLSPTITVLDELHAHPTRGLYDVMHSAKGKNAFSISIYITTAGTNLQGICYEERAVADNVLKGTTKIDHYFAFIATVDEMKNYDKDWGWEQANPSIRDGGNPVLRTAIESAFFKTNVSQVALDDFKTKRCNIWLSGHSRWLDVEKWDDCAAPELLLKDFLGQQVYVGVDLSERDDFTALALIFPDFKTGSFHLFTKFYMPSMSLQEKIRSGKTHYKGWAENKNFTIIEGNTVDYNIIRRDIEFFCTKFQPRKILFDQASGSHGIATDLMKMFGDRVGIMRKTASHISNAALDLEARVKYRENITHDGNPVMRYCIGNAVVDRRVDGSILPKKITDKSDLKIDGVDAMLHALVYMIAEGSHIDYSNYTITGA